MGMGTGVGVMCDLIDALITDDDYVCESGLDWLHDERIILGLAFFLFF